MADNRTLRQLITPDYNQQPSCMILPEVADNEVVEIKKGVVQVLPRFGGELGEDPVKHMHGFHVVCSSMKPREASEELFLMKAFPLTLKGRANDWFLYLPTGSIKSWAEMKGAFLEKYYPEKIASKKKEEIREPEQGDDEEFGDYWERFNRMCVECPYHGFKEEQLIFFFT